jgi:hypothetical protein
MNLWIVTIGSSDIQLDSDKVNREKGRTEEQRSDKVWQYWYDGETRAKCHDITPEPKKLYKDNDESYRIPPRVLGRVYEESDPEQKDEILSYLTYPLLDNFVSELKKMPESPDAIVILLTDQSHLFQDSNTLRKLKSPYWQDTCELQPILDSYFRQRFPQAEQVLVPIKPKLNQKGLDDWNFVLGLISYELQNLKINDTVIDPQSISTVYVSHQAGTPAISSAVQFASLAQFDKHVSFLVSSEQNDSPPEILPSSSYLKGFHKQEAKKLLERHDYSGVKDLISPYLDYEEHQDTRILLEAAIQWNLAKFCDFRNELEKHHAFKEIITKRTIEENWWWMAYEGAYLAIVRLEQDNVVESFFHSFRSIEGLIKEWALDKYQDQISYSNSSQPKTPYFHDEGLNDRLVQDWFNRSKDNRYNNVGLFGKPLFGLLKASYSFTEWRRHSYLKVLNQDTLEERNATFHSLRGLQKSDLFTVWYADNATQWEDNVLGCLNFISKQSFSSLRDVSLMAKVPKKLKEAIENL